MDERPSHPLLDRLEAKHSPPSLKETSLVMLRLHWSAVRDVGDAPFSLLKSLLPHSAADQLAEIEDNSPHIAPHTNGIWRLLCVREFIEVRKAVEDGRITKKNEPKSWKEQYSLEEVKREEKMQAIVSKLRGKNDEYKYGRATTKEVDWRLEKKRKSHAASSNARPKTLMEKARHNSKAIKSMYAPRRKPAKASAPVPSSRTTVPAAQEASFPPARLSAPGLATPRKRPADTAGPAPAATALTASTAKKRSAPESPPPVPASNKRAKALLSPPTPPRSQASPVRPPLAPPSLPARAMIPPSPRASQLFNPRTTPAAVPSSVAAGPPKPVPRGIFMPKRR